MKLKLSSILDILANRLEVKGLLKEAYELDMVANSINLEYHALYKQLQDAYKRQAPQDQIDRLETELAKLTIEEDMVGDIPATSEGYAIDEELRALYHQYLNADNKSITPYDRQELIGIMRGAMEEGLHGQDLSVGLTDAQILEAAKDAYGRYNELSLRRNNPNRINRTPEEALRNIGDIKDRLKLKP
jgi:hypothetical protein